jgi:hypothetical protein
MVTTAPLTVTVLPNTAGNLSPSKHAAVKAEWRT